MDSGSPARKGEPFSIRLTSRTDRFVTSEAKRTRRSKSSIVEMLTEEAARMRRLPGIGFRGSDADRRAWVIGAGLDVWQIIEALEDAESPAELANASDIPEALIRLAAAYRDQYPEEIAEAISQNRQPLDELLDLYPFFVAERLD